MKTETIELKDMYEVNGGKLHTYAGISPFWRPVEGWKRPAVIVLPGGGYAGVGAHEGEPIAVRFLCKGFQAFVLEYVCAPAARYPEQLLELACAVDYVKKHADEYNVNADEIFVVGFSAGGHLAGNLSTDYMQAIEAYGVPLDCKVSGAGLCYPVISDEYGHVGSFENLLGGMYEFTDKNTVEKVRLDKLVCERTAPTFVWSTAEDTVVPAMNALKYAESLIKMKIDYELHIYPQGEHGLAGCDQELHGKADCLDKPARWVEDCAAFFRRYCKELY